MLIRLNTTNDVISSSDIISNVHVIYGAHDLRLPVAGLTIDQVRMAYSGLLSVSVNTEAFVNGRQSTGSTVLTNGDRVEYMKISGRKGQDFWSKREFMRLTKISEEQWTSLREKGLRTFHVGEDEVIDDAECHKWIQRLIYSDDSIERAASKGKAGRKNTTADIAAFANARLPHKTWKEILGEWRTLYPNDTRVKKWQQIRDAWRRRYRGKK